MIYLILNEICIFANFSRFTKKEKKNPGQAVEYSAKCLIL